MDLIIDGKKVNKIVSIRYILTVGFTAFIFLFITVIFFPSSLYDLDYYFWNIACLNKELYGSCLLQPTSINSENVNTLDLNFLFFNHLQFSADQYSISRSSGGADANIYNFLNSYFMSGTLNFDILILLVIYSILHGLLFVIVRNRLSNVGQKALYTTYFFTLFFPSLAMTAGSFIPLVVAYHSYLFICILIFDSLVSSRVTKIKDFLLLGFLIILVSITRLDQILYLTYPFLIFFFLNWYLKYKTARDNRRKTESWKLFYLFIFFTIAGYLTSITNSWRRDIVLNVLGRLFDKSYDLNFLDPYFVEATQDGENFVKIISVQPYYHIIQLFPPHWVVPDIFEFILATLILIILALVLIYPRIKTESQSIYVFSIGLLGFFVIIVLPIIGFVGGNRMVLRYMWGPTSFLFYVIFHYFFEKVFLKLRTLRTPSNNL